MAIQLRNTKRIGNLKATIIIAVALFCDALKILLFFLNALPVVGTALDAIVSVFVSIIELIIDFGTLGFSGVYSGPGSTTNLLFTLAATAIDFAPIIDDLPITTVSVLFIIWNSRQTDKKENEKANKEAVKAQRAQLRQQEIRLQAAQTSVERAAAMRQQAMDVSRSAITPARTPANDDEEYPEAANYTPDDGFAESV